MADAQVRVVRELARRMPRRSELLGLAAGTVVAVDPAGGTVDVEVRGSVIDEVPMVGGGRHVVGGRTELLRQGGVWLSLGARGGPDVPAVPSGFAERSRTSAQSIPSGAETTLLCPTLVVSRQVAGPHWVPSSAADTIITAGVYRIGAGVRWELRTDASHRRVFVRVDGEDVAGTTSLVDVGIQVSQAVSRTVWLPAGAQVSAMVIHGAGSPLSVLDGRRTFRTLELVHADD